MARYHLGVPTPDRLDSWKEIAAYLGRGVRTVRRWEAEEGLPVHRHMHRALGSVYAFKSEIDAWRKSEGRTTPRRPASPRRGDPQATESAAEARQETFRWRRDAIDHAIQLLRDAIAARGESAELLAALGRAHLQYREAGVDLGPRPLEEAEGCMRRAFTLDPRSAAALQLRGWIRYSTWRTQDAVRDLQAALEASPDDPDTLAVLSNCYLISGHVHRARPLIERLLALDPTTPLTRCMPGFADIMEGRFAAALDPYRRMFEMDTGNPMARLFYAWVLALNGRREAVNDLVETAPAAVRETVPGRITAFFARALAGDGPGAVALVTPDIEAVADATDLFPRFLAPGYALAGEPERALHWLAIAVDRGFINHPFLATHDPFLAGVRGHPRFARLMETVRRRWEDFEP